MNSRSTIGAAVRRRIEELDRTTLHEQLRIVAIPAPTGEERARADHIEARFRALGVVSSRDAAGNVIGWLSASKAPPVVVVAHLDTVFAADVPLEPRREGRRVFAPGIADNARGLAALVTLADVLRAPATNARHPIVLVASVGEEGAGDLFGVKQLFRGEPFSSAHACIALDGSGVKRVVNTGIGSRRLRFEIHAAGGHSWSDWGIVNPVNVLAGAIARAERIALPASPRTTLTFARIGGGTSINSIPAMAWAEVDIRSKSPDALAQAERDCVRSLEREISARRAERHGDVELGLQQTVIGDRPAGRTSPEHPLVRAALEATRRVDELPELAASSTDANIPMSLGIPAVTLGAGGESGGTHTTEEWYENRKGAAGVERAALLILEVAGVPLDASAPGLW